MANNDNKFKIQTTANNVFMQSDDTSIEENVVSLKKNKTDILDSAFNQNLMSTAITNKNKLLYGKVADLSIHTGIVETDEEKYWEAYFNINKTLINLTEFDILFFQIKYCYNNEYYTTYINSNYSLLDNKFINKYIYAASDRDLPLLNNLDINSKYELDEENNISKIENNEYCCFTIVCSDTLMVGTLTEDDIEILNNMEISLYIGKQNVLLNNNTAEYTPTENYHPATKKYVDESKINLKLEGKLDHTVVIDYGLPVDIDVLKDEVFDSSWTLSGVGLSNNSISETCIGQFGDISIINNKIRYSLNTTEINTFDKFVYALTHNGNIYYGTVTIIPATTIYFEDNFLTLNSYTVDEENNHIEDVNSAWTTVGDIVNNVQNCSIKNYINSSLDSKEIYGYDSAYASFSKYSMGSAKKVTVDSNHYAKVTFDFYGTGFDVISLISNQTGVLGVKIYKYEENTATITKAVNTYYGYTKNSEGNWVTTDEDNSLYQIPVIHIKDLVYDHYTAVIIASYYSALDKTSADGYDLYIDAIHIYDPTGVISGSIVNEDISNVYIADNEMNPKYFEFNTLYNESILESATEISLLSLEYSEDGYTEAINNTFNNTIMISPKGMIVFEVSNTEKICIQASSYYDSVQLSYATSYDIGTKEFCFNNTPINTATFMYYKVAPVYINGKYYVILKNNSSNGLLHLSDLKLIGCNIVSQTDIEGFKNTILNIVNKDKVELDAIQFILDEELAQPLTSKDNIYIYTNKNGIIYTL